MKLLRYILTLFFCITLFPIVTNAQSVEALLSQIAALQKQIATIQAQLNTEVPQQGGLILTRNLDIGSRGDDVRELQNFLAKYPSIYPEAEVTGYFGVLTQRAVQRWQAREGVVAGGTPNTTGFGVVGPKTRRALAKASSMIVQEQVLVPEQEVVVPIVEEEIVREPVDPNIVIELPVHVHLLASSYESVAARTPSENIRAMFDVVNERFWKQANIQWVVRDVFMHTVTNGSDREFNNAMLRNDDIATSAQIPWLLEGAQIRGGFPVFVVHSLATVEENGRYSAHAGTVLISETNGRRSGVDYMSYLFAHELGHALGLGHEGTFYNLMHPGRAENTVAREKRTVLTPEQIEQARAQAALGGPKITR